MQSGRRLKFLETEKLIRSQSIQNCTSILVRRVLTYRIACGRNKKGFFHDLNKHIGWCASSTISVQNNNTVMQLQQKSLAVNLRRISLLAWDHHHKCKLMMTVSHCSIDDVIRTIRSSPSTTAGRDGYSYLMIKLLLTSIEDPFVIIF